MDKDEAANKLGGMGIREVTSQLEISYDLTRRKTAQQSERTAKSLTGKRDEHTHDKGGRVWDGSLNVGQEERKETMTGPFKWDFVNVAKGNGFSNSTSRTSESTRDHHCTQTLDENGHT